MDVCAIAAGYGVNVDITDAGGESVPSLGENSTPPIITITAPSPATSHGHHCRSRLPAGTKSWTVPKCALLVEGRNASYPTR
jgi:hypothetical protein